MNAARHLSHAAVAATVVLATAATVAVAAPKLETPETTRPKTIETTFESVDAVLAGQWDFPLRAPAPLVVLIPGGGRMDRNGWAPTLGENPDHGIYATLSKKLVAAGFAVFRYDKPGAGKSSKGRYATERSNALEAYTRAVDHARIDADRVFIVGHAAGTDTVAGIYKRYETVLVPAGVALLDNAVGETEALSIGAPTLIVNSGKNPDDRLQYGKFVKEARDNADGELETELVLLDRAEAGLLSQSKLSGRIIHTVDPNAVRALIDWLLARVDSAPERAARPPAGNPAFAAADAR